MKGFSFLFHGLHRFLTIKSMEAMCAPGWKEEVFHFPNTKLMMVLTLGVMQPCTWLLVCMAMRDLSRQRRLSIYPTLTNFSFPASEFKDNHVLLILTLLEPHHHHHLLCFGCWSQSVEVSESSET